MRVKPGVFQAEKAGAVKSGRPALASARAGLAGGVTGVAGGLLFFLGQSLALLAGSALLRLDRFLGLGLCGKTCGVPLGLFPTGFRLGEFMLLTQRLLLGRTLGGEFVEFGIGGGGLGLEPGEQGLLGLLLGGKAVREAGLFQISHAEGVDVLDRLWMRLNAVGRFAAQPGASLTPYGSENQVREAFLASAPLDRRQTVSVRLGGPGDRGARNAADGCADRPRHDRTGDGTGGGPLFDGLATGGGGEGDDRDRKGGDGALHDEILPTTRLERSPTPPVPDRRFM